MYYLFVLLSGQPPRSALPPPPRPGHPGMPSPQQGLPPPSQFGPLSGGFPPRVQRPSGPPPGGPGGMPPPGSQMAPPRPFPGRFVVYLLELHFVKLFKLGVYAILYNFNEVKVSHPSDWYFCY